MNIQEVLRGCTTGRMQSVGQMQVIPLISEIEDLSFMAPVGMTVWNTGYGNLRVRNPHPKPVIMPASAAYVTKQAAQDHALPTAKIARAASARAGATPTPTETSFDDAMCIQQSQGGYIPRAEHEFTILPFSLREAAAENASGDYSRLWPAIGTFLQRMGVPGSSNLVSFLNAYEKQLDEFVAEFEPVPNQVGAIFLVAGRICGIERVPNHEFWLNCWRPLIRDCYGSVALMADKMDEPPPTRTPLRDVTSLEALEAEIERAERAEAESVRSMVENDFLGEDFEATNIDSQGGYDLSSVRHAQFVGQTLRQPGDVVSYASLVVAANWPRKARRLMAPEFTL